jgi:hypothetical protein
MASSFFNSNNCSRSVLAKTSGFARNWPLAPAKFAAVFLMDFQFCIRLAAASKSRLCAKNLL